MINKKLIGTMSGLLMAFSATHAEDLLEVYRLALENDPQLGIAAAQVRSTREVRKQAFAGFLPNLSGTLSYNDTSGDFQLVNGTSGAISQTQEQLRVQLLQSIYDRSNYTRLDAARAQLAQTEADYEAALDSLLLRVSEAYFGVLTSEDALRFARAEETANERQLEQAEQRFEVGLTAITDVHEARAAYDRSRANVIVAQNNVDDASEGLRELTDQDIGSVLPLREDYALDPPQPANAEDWVSEALSGNPAIMSRKFAADAAYHNVKSQRAGHFPTLGASVTYQDNASSGDLGPFSTSDQNNTSIGIQLTVPMYEGGANASRTRQAAADYDAALERLEQERRAATRATRNSYRAVLAGISQIEAFRQAVVSAQSALEATEAGFEVGTRTIVDVLLAQRTLFQAQRDYSQARHDLVLNRLRLRASTGGIAVSDLEEVNRFLQ